MNVLKLALSVTAAAFLLAGCGGHTALPDGGTTDRLVCANGIPTMAIQVMDASGKPVSGATVTAKNVASGKTVTGTTDERGITQSVTNEIGSGTIRVSATMGTLSSAVTQVDWICGECTCSATPNQVVLTVQ